MPENLAPALPDEIPEEDLADDIIFEPSSFYEGHRAAIAIKDGVPVCWCCFDPVMPDSYLDAIMGEGSIVRICRANSDCRAKVGKANRKRGDLVRDGKIILLGGLSEKERLELLAETAHEGNGRGKK